MGHLKCNYKHKTSFSLPNLQMPYLSLETKRKPFKKQNLASKLLSNAKCHCQSLDMELLDTATYLAEILAEIFLQYAEHSLYVITPLL